jgi:hypothetical protein
MSSFRTLQFFADELLSKLTDESLESLLAGDVEAVLVLAEPMSAIDPTDGGHRDQIARFRGSLAERAAAMRRTFRAYAIPAGTEMIAGVGVNGTTVAGNSAFLQVPEGTLVKANDLGDGASADIRERFVTWVEAQG